MPETRLSSAKMGFMLLQVWPNLIFSAMVVDYDHPWPFMLQIEIFIFEKAPILSKQPNLVALFIKI